MEIPKIVNNLVQKFETRDPFKILKSLDVILVYYPLNSVNGFYQYFQRNSIVYIDEQLADSEAMLVCAHELGHMLLHKKANAIFLDSRMHFNTCKYEMEANRFAMNLLIPNDMIEEHLDFTTAQLSRLLGYNQKLIELRLKDFI